MRKENEFENDEEFSGDFDEALEDESSEAEDSPNAVVTVAVNFDLAEAQGIKNLLETKGMPVIVTDYEDFQIDDIAAHIARGVNLCVYVKDEFDALEAVEEFREEHGFTGELGNDTGWGVCPKCASKNLEITEVENLEKPIFTFFKTLYLRRDLLCSDCGHIWETRKP